jgi:hypothetical protein
LETRRIQVSTALNDYLKFPYCGQIFRLYRERIMIKTGKVEKETVYGLTSLTPDRADPARLLALCRGHWSIENCSHHVRDMTYDEDRQQIRREKGPQAMAGLRNFAISFLRLMGYKNIASAVRACGRSTRRTLLMLGV